MKTFRIYVSFVMIVVTTIFSSGQTAPAVSPLTLVNISCRGLAGHGNDSFIVGFNLMEDGHRVLIRAVGPTLSSFGVTGVCRDPHLTVFKGRQEIANNDDWENNEDTRTSFSRAGAFALPAGSQDSVVIMSLSAGSYSAVANFTGDAGIVLVEVYDLDPSPTGLNNVSVRGMTSPGETVLIPAFSLMGFGSSSLLIREVGPSLKIFGVAKALDDPKFALHHKQGNQFVLLREAQGWAGYTNDFFNARGAFSLSEPGDAVFSFRSSISGVSAVEPFNIYTVTAGSASGSSGIVVVEIYKW